MAEGFPSETYPWFPPNDNYPPIFPTYPESQRKDVTQLPRYVEPVNVVCRPGYTAKPLPKTDHNVRPVVGGGIPTCGTYPKDLPTLPVAALKHTMRFSHPGLKGWAEGYNH